MSTTRAKLETITDAGEFERLASAVLRYADPDCAALIHPGANAQGRPIASPVDGFSLGMNPEAGVLIAHTTMATPRLANKWLGKAEGDIAKAARTAATLGLKSAKLILTTSREPSPELLVKAREASAASDLSLEIWPQSRLADFLDHDPDGQWVRRHFFGDSASRLSAGQLQEWAEEGPVELAIFDPPNALSPRKSATELASRLLDGQRLMLLNASSGQGKTVAVAQVWRQMVEAGALAVHLTHEDVEAVTSLPEALERALRRRSPVLAAGCGATALELAADRPFLLLVEDVNRAARPLAALRKVILWQRQEARQGLRVLCPVWPRGVTSLPEQESKAVLPFVNWLDLPNHEEAVDIASAQARAQGRDPSTLPLDSIVKSLGCDPLLLGLHDYREDAADGVRAFIERESRRVASAHGLSASDILDALDALATGMLRDRRLEPSWGDVRRWLRGEQADLLRRLADSGSIVRLGGDSEHIVFRHDRVRDQVRGSGLRRILADEFDATDILTEPAYAELWGGALADPASPDGSIARAAELNPLGLFHGIALTSPGSMRRDQLMDAALRWLGQPEALSEAHAHLRWAAQLALVEVEDRRIADLVNAFRERTWMTSESACWNGDMAAVLRLIMSWDPYRPTGREKRIFSHLRAKHAVAARDFINAGLQAPETSTDRKIELLAFAGRLRETGLADAIDSTWRTTERTPELINSSLWAAAFCAPQLIPEILDAWAELPEGPLEHGRTPRGSVGYDLRFGFWASADRCVLDALLSRVRDPNDVLSFYVGNLIEGWDDADAQEAYVRLLAHRLARSRPSGGGLVGYNLGEMWGVDQIRGGYTMSDASLIRLAALWKDASEDLDVRIVALRLWGQAARPRHLAAARASPALDPLGVLGSEAVCALIFLEDPKAHEALEQLIENDLSRAHLIQYVRGRWRDVYQPVLTRLLNLRRRLKIERSDVSFHVDHALPELMKELDDATRTRLLEEHWDHVGEESGYVQLALWTATPGSLALAKQSLDAGDAKETLRFLSMHYNLYPTSQPQTTDLRRMQALEPWLDDLDDLAFSQLEDHCNRQGWRDWRRIHIDPRLEPKPHATWRTAASRRAALDQAAEEKRGRRSLHFTFQHMVESVGSSGAVLDEVQVWLAERRDLPALHTACDILIEANSRTELPRCEIWRALDIPEGHPVIDDAIFAVKRHTLS